MQAGEEGGATPTKDPASEASTTLCSTDLSQLLGPIDPEACANTRDSFCSNASTDAGGELSARESPRDHGASATAGQDEGQPDAAQRSPSAANFPFTGDIPPGWRSDAVLSLGNKLHKEIMRQLLKVVINTQGSKRTAPATSIKSKEALEQGLPVGLVSISKVVGGDVFAANTQKAKSIQAHDLFNPSLANMLCNVLFFCIGNTHGSRQNSPLECARALMQEIASYKNIVFSTKRKAPLRKQLDSWGLKLPPSMDERLTVARLDFCGTLPACVVMCAWIVRVDLTHAVHFLAGKSVDVEFLLNAEIRMEQTWSGLRESLGSLRGAKLDAACACGGSQQIQGCTRCLAQCLLHCALDALQEDLNSPDEARALAALYFLCPKLEEIIRDKLATEPTGFIVQVSVVCMGCARMC